MPDPLISQLRRDEGEILHAYQDHRSFWTIGVGRLIDRRRGGGITSEESDYLLRNDLKRINAALDAALPWSRKLSPARRGVLQNMAFQLGVAGLLGFKTSLGLIEAGRYVDAAEQMLKSKWARQTPERANRLAEQMRSGQWR